MKQYNSCTNGCHCTDNNTIYVKRTIIDSDDSDEYIQLKPRIIKHGNCKCADCPNRSCASAFYAFLQALHL